MRFRQFGVEMMRGAGVIAVLAISGCTVLQSTADDLTRTQAKRVVNIELAQRLPGQDLSGATDCVIDNASSQELFKLAGASVTGVNASTGKLVADILLRPATGQCILKQAIRL